MTTPDPKVERALRAFFEAMEAHTGPFLFEPDDLIPENGDRCNEIWASMDAYREAIAAALKAAEEPTP